ncbi:hypothetical protein GQ600_4435 [Phytophthora cactorum]|nr:hypothetical protein GQ600_4435 [Phytophthora cactorum]
MQARRRANGVCPDVFASKQDQLYASQPPKFIASIAANGIYMMQRFYRVDHAALAGPNLLPFESFALRQYLIRNAFRSKKTVGISRNSPNVLYRSGRYALRPNVKLRHVSSPGVYLTSALNDYQLQLTLDKLAGQSFYFDFRSSVETSGKNSTFEGCDCCGS